jgi:hypothetical protein
MLHKRKTAGENNVKNTLSILGWLVAVVAIVAAGMLFAKNRSLQNDLESANNSLEQSHKPLNDSTARGASKDDDVPAGAEETGQQLAMVEQSSAASSVADEPDDEVTPAEPEANEAEQPDNNAMRRAQRAQLGVMVGMQYNSLLEDLALPEETLNAVNDILIDAYIEAQQATVQDMMSGTSTAKDAKAKQDAIDARVREQLSEVLDKDELAQWDSYQDFADEVLYEALLDGQLAMLAPGLSEETRQTAKIVLAEELAAGLDRFFETDTIYTLDSFNDAQLEGLNQGMANMPDTISEEQYGHLTSFMNQVATAFEQMKQQ